MLRTALTLVIFAALAGCQNALDALDDGTTAGFQKCLDRGSAQSLEKDTVRNVCIDKHERKIDLDIGGRAGWIKAYSSPDRYSFQGNVTNKSRDFVVTKYEVKLIRSVPDNSQRMTYEHLWIEPGSTRSFAFSVDDILDQPNTDSLKQDGGWQIVAVYGIKIKI